MHRQAWNIFLWNILLGGMGSGFWCFYLTEGKAQ